LRESGNAISNNISLRNISSEKSRRLGALEGRERAVRDKKLMGIKGGSGESWGVSSGREARAHTHTHTSTGILMHTLAHVRACPVSRASFPRMVGDGQTRRSGAEGGVAVRGGEGEGCGAGAGRRGTGLDKSRGFVSLAAPVCGRMRGARWCEVVRGGARCYHGHRCHRDPQFHNRLAPTSRPLAHEHSRGESITRASSLFRCQRFLHLLCIRPTLSILDGGWFIYRADVGKSAGRILSMYP
jgi:hypothetical protein